ncbi:hypothetical protein SARC_08103 [Sphaeroforma arctica JP610]|uniref:Tyrosine-protein phosphatase domain-containing protein n=1 Tax=Sphaeroforma arctica JP610 TaxID=667725 RepID=A0A0L0FSC5_9EUKA|nr:hypothetical protein SARC_08103 [Sphaeroforma arctica JP610]KNC79496.1 hypothetical protein SARC_08103 [Sphaeroforma arctica JP610]|eukprot:XP_014153398.1 hypothetical protein SARC_08103 [Sphaeroforma arctica JP610]
MYIVEKFRSVMHNINMVESVLPVGPYGHGNGLWEYNSRRDMQEVIPGVFLGPYSCALRQNVERLERCNVTHVVCIRHTKEACVIRPNSPDRFKYLVLTVADDPEENIIHHFPVFRDFINEAQRNGTKALVHGNAGISRSAALVIAYGMEYYNTSFEDAFKVIQSYRFCIHPSEAFCYQLKEYENIYKARASQGNGRIQSSRKRQNREDADDGDRGNGQTMLM